MYNESLATVTSKGQITVPAEVRRQWQLKPGDQIAFRLVNDTEGAISPRRKRSIFERLSELKLPALDHAVTRNDIEASVAAAMLEKHGKAGR